MSAATIPLLATYDVTTGTGDHRRYLAQAVTGEQANQVAGCHDDAEIVRHPDYVSPGPGFVRGCGPYAGHSGLSADVPPLPGETQAGER